MGIKGLWGIVSPVGERKKLLELAEAHKVEADANVVTIGDHRIRLGVDMDACMAECTGATLAAGIYNQLPGGGLNILFNKLTAFLRAPVHLVCVFDGNMKPKVKRGHHVIDKKPWWVEHAKEMIRHFGYEVHQAPAEGEAELARLNREGIIHGVITSDSDTFVFGVTLLLRTIPNKNRMFNDEYEVYTAAALEDDKNDLALTQGGLLLFALLVGGDYSSGVRGCGVTTAHALVRCGFGDQLLQVAAATQGKALDKFLAEWRFEIQKELTSNSRGMLDQRQPHIASLINAEFPDRTALRLYLRPITSWSPGQEIPTTNLWRPREPSISGLVQFCTDHFLWKPVATLKKKFESLVWEGAILQMLYSPLLMYDPQRKLLRTPKSKAVILKASAQVRRGKFTLVSGKEPQPKLLVSTSDFVSSMSISSVGTKDDKVTVWVSPRLLPASIAVKYPRKKSVAAPSAPQVMKKSVLNPKDKGSSKTVFDEIIVIDSSDSEEPGAVDPINPKGEGSSLGVIDLDSNTDFIDLTADSDDD